MSPTQRYSAWEKCPKCGSAAPKPRLVDRRTLSVTCHSCGFVWHRRTLDSDGKPNWIERIRAAVELNRVRTIEKIAQVVEALSVDDEEQSKGLKVLAAYIRTLKTQKIELTYTPADADPPPDE